MSANVKTRAPNSEGLVTCRILACALWLRTKAISCVPGMLISAMNMPRPWRCLASSLRSKLAPIQLAVLSRSCMSEPRRRILSTFIVCEVAAVNVLVNPPSYAGYRAISLSSRLISPPSSFGRNDFPFAREVLDDLQAGADHVVPHDGVGPLCV